MTKQYAHRAEGLISPAADSKCWRPGSPLCRQKNWRNSWNAQDINLWWFYREDEFNSKYYPINWMLLPPLWSFNLPSEHSDERWWFCILSPVDGSKVDWYSTFFNTSQLCRPKQNKSFDWNTQLWGQMSTDTFKLKSLKEWVLMLFSLTSDFKMLKSLQRIPFNSSQLSCPRKPGNAPLTLW